MVIRLALTLLYAVLATALLPVFFILALTTKKLRGHMSERLGGGVWSEYRSNAKPIWIHAASVGELQGVEPVVAMLKNSSPDTEVVITTTSLTGREKARQLVDTAGLLPLDHPIFISRFLRKVDPSVLVIVETEIWPNLLLATKRERIPIYLINGRISDYSFPSYRRFRYFLKPVLSFLDTVYVQTPRDAERFEVLGVDSATLEVVGSTKYDRSTSELGEEERASLLDSLGLSQEEECFVAGSVRPGEDEEVISAFARAQETCSRLQMIIAPRHPERFDAVANLLERENISFHRRSAGVAPGKTNVVLLDTIGELGKMYALASFAFVGGTLKDYGGHNPLEPASFGVPVILGPFSSTVRDIASALKEAGGAIEVSEKNELQKALIALSESPNMRKEIGSRAQEVWRGNLGAIDRVRELLTGPLEK